MTGLGGLKGGRSIAGGQTSCNSGSRLPAEHMQPETSSPPQDLLANWPLPSQASPNPPPLTKSRPPTSASRCSATQTASLPAPQTTPAAAPRQSSSKPSPTHTTRCPTHTDDKHTMS